MLARIYCLDELYQAEEWTAGGNHLRLEMGLVHTAAQEEADEDGRGVFRVGQTRNHESPLSLPNSSLEEGGAPTLDKNDSLVGLEDFRSASGEPSPQ